MLWWTRERRQLAGVVVEPARHVIADPTKRRAGAAPQPRRDVHGDRHVLFPRNHGEVDAGTRALEEQGAARPAQEADRAVAAPQVERLALVQRLVVPVPRHLENRVAAGGCDVREARQREGSSQLDPPLRCGALGLRLRVGQVDGHRTENKWGPALRHAGPHLLTTATRTRGQSVRSASLLAAQELPRRQPRPPGQARRRSPGKVQGPRGSGRRYATRTASVDGATRR
jgi:hypothetical protein